MIQRKYCNNLGIYYDTKQVKEKSKLGSIGKESFQARIYPGIDYAFIMSLLVIFNEIDL